MAETPTSRLERTIVSLRETAELVDKLPNSLRTSSIFGPLVSSAQLRRQADYLESTREALLFLELEPDDPTPTIPQPVDGAAAARHYVDRTLADIVHGSTELRGTGEFTYLPLAELGTGPAGNLGSAFLRRCILSEESGQNRSEVLRALRTRLLELESEEAPTDGQ